MRKKWLVEINGKLEIVSNRGVEHPHFIGEVEPGYEDVKFYKLYVEEDGSCCALIIEREVENEKTRKLKEKNDFR